MSLLAETLIGDTVSANIMMLGYSSQKDLLPISPNSIKKAIELNGVSIDQNIKAFSSAHSIVAKYPLKPLNVFAYAPVLALGQVILFEKNT